MPKYKNPPTLYSTDIYKAISENSENLTIPQIKECFEIYADLVERLAKSKHREKGFIIPLPKLGHFYFISKKGRKKGSTYKMPKNFYRTREYDIIDDTDNKYFTVELAEDQPDYEIISFKVYHTLYTDVKRISKEKNGK